MFRTPKSTKNVKVGGEGGWTLTPVIGGAVALQPTRVRLVVPHPLLN